MFYAERTMSPAEMKRWRKAHKMLQHQLGLMVGVSVRTVNRWEAKNPTKRSGIPLSVAMWLREWDGNPEALKKRREPFVSAGAW